MQGILVKYIYIFFKGRKQEFKAFRSLDMILVGDHCILYDDFEWSSVCNMHIGVLVHISGIVNIFFLNLRMSLLHNIIFDFFFL